MKLFDVSVLLLTLAIISLQLYALFHKKESYNNSTSNMPTELQWVFEDENYTFGSD